MNIGKSSKKKSKNGEGDYILKSIEEYEKDKKYTVLRRKVEWGGEEAINEIIPALLKVVDGENKVSFEWEE